MPSDVQRTSLTCPTSSASASASSLVSSYLSGAAYASDRLFEISEEDFSSHIEFQHGHIADTSNTHQATPSMVVLRWRRVSSLNSSFYSINHMNQKLYLYPHFLQLDWEECAAPSLQAHSTWSKPDSNPTSSAKNTQR